MPYRFAIIGCGNISGRHAAAIHTVGKLAAVCDTNASRAASLAAQYQANSYNHLGKLLEGEHPDCVAVCTPNGLHPVHAIAALRSGSHVICEKPLAISVEEGTRMLQAAKSSGKKLFVVKQNRFNPPVETIKKLVDENRLGPIQSFQINCYWNRPAAYYTEPWKGTLDMDGGTLFTQFSHFIDLLFWFLGEIKTVSGWRINANHRGIIDFEDTGIANIIMQNGSIGNIHYTINAHDSNMEGSITLFGEKGTVKIGGQYLNRIDHFSVENEMQPELHHTSPANSYGFYKGSMSNHHLVYNEVVKSLDNLDNSLVEADEALKSVEMIEQIYAASPFIYP